MGNCFYKWYSEGIYTIPPPCLYIGCLRRLLSNNGIFLGLSRFGYKWADERRSQIMFIAFWLSLASFILLVSPGLSLVSNEGLVSWNPWVIVTADPKSTDDFTVYYYIGLRYVKMECEGSGCDMVDVSSFQWTDDHCHSMAICSDEGDNDCSDFCTECQESSFGVFSLAATGAVSVIPQILVNVQRSTARGDLPCQKVVGAFASFLGFVTTAITLIDYLEGCYFNLPVSPSNANVEYQLGAAFWCTLVACILKIFDFITNLIVSVPEHGYWGEGKDGEVVAVDFGEAAASAAIAIQMAWKRRSVKKKIAARTAYKEKLINATQKIKAVNYLHAINKSSSNKVVPSGNYSGVNDVEDVSL